MKYIILFFALLSTGVSVAQTRSVAVTSSPRTDILRPQERVDLRQHGITIQNFSFTAPASVTAQQTIRTINVPPGRVYYIEELTMQASKSVEVQIATDADNLYNEPVYVQRLTVGTTSATIKPMLKIQGGQSATISLQVVAGVDASSVRITGGFSGYETVQDWNFGADKQILFVGDSQTYGASLSSDFKSYTRSDVWVYKVLDYFRDKGESVRPVVDAVIGSTTTHIENKRLTGQLDKGLKPSLIVYMAGVNNTLSTGSTPAGYNSAQAHFEAFIDWKKKQHPNAVLLMISPAPVLNTARETDVAAVRLLMQNAVTSAGGPSQKIFYANGGNAFTATNTANYNGDGLHHNVVGSAALFTNTIKPVLDASILTLPVIR